MLNVKKPLGFERLSVGELYVKIYTYDFVVINYVAFSHEQM
jgi:hypothetical protein